MGIDVSEVRWNKYLHRMHLLTYLLSIIYFIMSLFESGQNHVVLNAAGLVCFCLFFIIELVAIQKNHKKPISQKLSMGYYIVRGLFDVVLVLSSFYSPHKFLFTVFMILFATEIAFFVAYDEMSRRGICYGIFSAVYGLASVVIVVYKYLGGEVTITMCLMEIAQVLVVLGLIVALGEILAGIWNSFIKQLLAQNRALEDLNDANDELKEHQDRISKVNELLGTQKIELQAANKKINRAHDEMSVQSEISGCIASSVEKIDMLTQITQILRLRLDLDLVAVVLEEDNSLLAPGEKPKGRSLVVSSSMGDDFEKNLRKSVEETDLKELLLLHKTYIQNVVADSTKFFGYLTTSQELPSVIYLPIYEQDERLGTLVIGKNKEHVFTEGRAFYENITSQLSIGISNARLYEKMNDMAIRDGLTRIYNRRHLSELVNQFVKEANRDDTTLSVAMFDIDKFKNVNDTYGHKCGDEVICYVAHILNRKAIEYDGIAGRYGGEEFVVAFPGKSLDEAYKIIEQMQQEIKSAPVKYEDKTVEVRASAGIANYPQTCKDPALLVNRSDSAMYYSKRTGRDRITIDDEKVTAEM